MKKLYVVDHEAGNIIEEVKSIDEGIALIREYEEEDKKEGIYSEGFYDIDEVDNGYHTTVWKGIDN